MEKNQDEQMKKIPKVSIIVPIYNVEEYLEECLDSIVGQTLKEIEIICINDGSKDGSLAILKRYAEKDSRIIIVDKKNEGYGVGMNIGLDRSTGEYIGIVEPDDYVPLNMYEDLYSRAVEYNLDFIKADFYRFKRPKDGSEELTYEHLSKNKKDYNAVFNPSQHPETLKFIMNTWSGIYKNSFLQEHHIRHNTTPGASFQDNGFWFQTFCYGTRAMIVDKPYYRNRRDNPNSSVKDPTKVYCMNREYQYIREIVGEDRELWDRFKYYYSRMKFGNYMVILHRIYPKFKKKYVEDFRREFLEARENGELDTAVFEFDYGRLVKWLLDHPKRFYIRTLMVEHRFSRKLWKIIDYIPWKVEKYFYDNEKNSGRNI